MIIQHNISALNSYRNLSMNNGAISGNLEKLSSGYRINRAGDDAAGLAISEKMRAQITGLETAQKNANDGISLVQTAEGALTEVHTMLNRMVELAQQSSNGTIQDEVDRENIQAEVDALKDEINRISESTNFNGINLLDGSLNGTSAVKGENLGGDAISAVVDAVKGKFTATATLNTAGTDATTITIEYKMGEETVKEEITYEGSTTTNTAVTNLQDALKDELGDLFDITVSTNGEITFEAKEAGSSGPVIEKVGNNAATVAQNGHDGGLRFDANLDDGDTFKIDGKVYGISSTSQNEEEGIYEDATALYNALKKEGYKLVDSTNGADETAFGAGVVLVRDPEKNKGLELQIGDSSDSFNQITVSIGAMNTTALGIADINLGNQSDAQAAVEVIKNAINKVSSTRGDLGAIQNRLEHTINNLGVTAENMTAAESRIRDVDMAKEMMEYTKNNILIQSSQAMLAQANQLPQGVLQLLQ